MITCTRCGNETWASELVTRGGPVMLAGPHGTAPQPVVARVCTACGYIELYGPQPIVDQPAVSEATTAQNVPATAPAPLH
ncbi:MAG: hypothetical protein HGA45_13760 [Chloroflexales bacterium]|nr:hypothetical protein [Chloroflexales bacterium]